MEWTTLESGCIEISLDKNLTKIEAKVARILGAPTFVRRPMDKMNSALWVLMDGTRNVRAIVEELDAQFNDAISPVEERVSNSIAQFVELGLVSLTRMKNDFDWDIGPSVV
ncbi:MAG: PqqD family peptide modification chaperone [Candidatus Thermoplasmatota archaeon]|nr:PqqD family peptide modification chaperone [Candidatus Thermoplasmatota archaeon]